RFNQLEEELSSITCPTLVVRGEESVFSDEEAERVARQIPDATWMQIEGAGHTIQGDNPRGLAAALHSFLEPGNNAWPNE
ncbi:MAG TPA: alpha/beta hydrolase, partial [Actinomycetota bacterium]|nr:alpha/beta hydrolase [Actinomycetota bacterium]